MKGSDLVRIRSLLEQDRVWCAYALADLEPPFVERTSWFVDERAVVMTYDGLTPPWLFAHGDPDEVEGLFADIPAGAFQYALLATHRARLADRLRPTRQVHMWRMVLRPDALPAGRAGGAVALGPADLPQLEDLFGDHPDRPDSFEASQLESGEFYGVREEGELVAVAGTHVVGSGVSAAGIGNVFTRPDRRRRGHARCASAAVVEALLRREIATIVLNVAMDNEPALAVYRGLGFAPFCGYYEGVGELDQE